MATNNSVSIEESTGPKKVINSFGRKKTKYIKKMLIVQIINEQT